MSLTLFVRALRVIGAARTSAVFSTAPFAGAILSVAILHEPLTTQLVAAGAVMAFGVWMLVREV